MARPARKYAEIDDRLGDEQLADRLRFWKAAGVSAPAIARMLTMETGIEVSREAVRFWLHGQRGAA